MSDLQCPARVFLARHGEADPETYLTPDAGGGLSAAGREQALTLARSLHSERVARVWCSPMHSAVQTAEIVAGILGLEVLVREGLRECGVGGLPGSPGDEAAIDGGERIGDVILRMGTILMEVADQHRGEAALVVSHGRAILATVPHLVGLPPAPARSKVLPCGGRVGLEYDSDGWRLA